MAARPTALVPSPKFQAYVRVSPSGSWDPLASNATKLPSTALLELPKLAVGARLPPWETRSSEPGLQARARTKPMPKSVRQSPNGRNVGGTGGRGRRRSVARSVLQTGRFSRQGYFTRHRIARLGPPRAQ